MKKQDQKLMNDILANLAMLSINQLKLKKTLQDGFNNLNDTIGSSGTYPSPDSTK